MEQEVRKILDRPAPTSTATAKEVESTTATIEYIQNKRTFQDVRYKDIANKIEAEGARRGILAVVAAPATEAQEAGGQGSIPGKAKAKSSGGQSTSGAIGGGDAGALGNEAKGKAPSSGGQSTSGAKAAGPGAPSC